MPLIAGVVAAMRRLPTAPLEGTTYTHGPSNGTTYNIFRDNVDLSVFAVPSDLGELLAVTIPLSTASTAGAKFRPVVYNPSTKERIAVGGELVTTGGEAQLVLTFAEPVPLTGGQSYAIGMMTNSSVIDFQRTDAGSYLYGICVGDDYANGAPDPLVDQGAGSGGYVMTITYTPAA